MADISQGNQLPALNRFPRVAGTIVATTTAKDNSDTAVPFNLKAGQIVTLIPDVACYVSCEFASGAITAANGVPVGAGEKFGPFFIPAVSSTTSVVKIAVKSASGTCTCLVLTNPRG